MAYEFHFATLTKLGARISDLMTGAFEQDTAYEIALAYLDLALATAIAVGKTEQQFQADIEMLLRARRERSASDFKKVS